MSRRGKRGALFLVLLSGSGAGIDLRADTFGSGVNEFVIEFAEIGDPGNPDDTGTTGSFSGPFGGVDEVFRMGIYEVSRDMVLKANAEGMLGISLADLSSSGGNGANRPATGMTWGQAARFVNWLNDEAGFVHAYKFATQPGMVGYNQNEPLTLWDIGDAGFDPANPFRNSQAYYFLPSEDEFYKAAYYSGSGSTYFDYATGSDTAPTIVLNGTASETAVYGQLIAPPGPADVNDAGGLSPYGTMGQNGNVQEFLEGSFDGTNDDGDDNRAFRGGSWVGFESDLRSSTRFEDMVGGGDALGFRVASLPEPSSMLLAMIGVGGALLARRRNSGRL